LTSASFCNAKEPVKIVLLVSRDSPGYQLKLQFHWISDMIVVTARLAVAF